MHVAKRFPIVGDRPGIINKIIGRAARRGRLWSQRGFTLIELLAVMSILGVLTGIVSFAVGDLGGKGSEARLKGDANTIGTSADRFFTDAFPQTYPVVSCCKFDGDADGNTAATADDTPGSIIPISQPGTEDEEEVDFGVRLIDFDADLPGDPKRIFVPDLLKEIPDSAALVSWRIETSSGQVFFTEDGAVLARPSGSKFTVKADSTVVDDGSGAGVEYTFTQQWKKGGAAQVELHVEIPIGYSIGGQSLDAGVLLGSFTTQFYTDNPWDPGQVIDFEGIVRATGKSNEWEAVINLGEVDDRVYTISIKAGSIDTPGQMTIVTDRLGDDDVPDTDFEESSGTWVLTINATDEFNSEQLFINPTDKGVYRWLAEEHTATDIADIFSPVPGNTAVVIKAS